MNPVAAVVAEQRPTLNNIIEQDHRFIKKRITASLGFRSAEGACRTIEGYEAMHAIRKGRSGETIEFMLSPKRDLIAAKLFLRLALTGACPPPRVINVNGHPAYPSAIAELKQSRELGRRCRCRTSPYFK